MKACPMKASLTIAIVMTCFAANAQAQHDHLHPEVAWMPARWTAISPPSGSVVPPGPTIFLVAPDFPHLMLTSDGLPVPYAIAPIGTRPTGERVWRVQVFAARGTLAISSSVGEGIAVLTIDPKRRRHAHDLRLRHHVGDPGIAVIEVLASDAEAFRIDCHGPEKIAIPNEWEAKADLPYARGLGLADTTSRAGELRWGLDLAVRASAARALCRVDAYSSDGVVTTGVFGTDEMVAADPGKLVEPRPMPRPVCGTMLLIEAEERERAARGTAIMIAVTSSITALAAAIVVRRRRRRRFTAVV